MDKQQAIQIIEALANGVDPVSGEIFPADSPYQNAEVTRALFHALDALKKGKPSQQLPARQGEPWTTEEDQQLRQGLLNRKEVPELAKVHQRTHGAIRSRIKHLGLLEVRKLG